DPDREGEAIAWHLALVLGIDDKKIKRVKFNEITKPCVKEAIKNSGKLDMNLVDAQQARRLLDRIVGYKLSPVLWKNIKSGLSAGRVQSVATRMIVDRENEIKDFCPKEYWTVEASLNKGDGKKFSSYYYGTGDKKHELKNKAEAEAVLSDISGKSFTVKSIKKAERLKHPAPPFTTSTLQQEAYKRLGFPSAKTMKTAQELYEGISLGEKGTHGVISYMRTDSLRISDVAAESAKEYITKEYGENFYPKTRRVYKSRNGAQDAHEAIRPSYLEYPPKSIRAYLSNDQYKLYKLIWERFISSQMASAVIDTVTIDSVAGSSVFRSTGSVIKFAGFMSVYEETNDEGVKEDNTSYLPAVNEGDILKADNVEAEQHFTQPPARYTEATLIKALEEKGIGRPSTYTPTITTIIQRGYVERVAKALAPTPLGEATNSLMVDNFPDIADYNFTAGMEDNLDQIESGERALIDVLEKFYKDFKEEMEKAEETVKDKSYKLPVIETDIVCEKCGSTMVIKSGRFGKFAACPKYPACKNTKPLDKDGKLAEPKAESTEEKAAVQKAPDDIRCDICGGEMVIKRSRYGTFYACAKYPECKGTKPINRELDVPCPDCGSKIVIRRGRNRTVFYSCSSYPSCKFTSCDTPTNEKCPNCGKMLLRKRGKNISVCIDKECGYKAEVAEGSEE
ncbi:MAG: type I DNA topoisomerase, partial [Clostridia bacterium]|nr:type I DNA topoisomerase [Clostridia bacterium]